jgi:hypothetical protein
MDDKGIEYYKIYFESINCSGGIIIEIKNGKIEKAHTNSRDYLIKFKKISKNQIDLEGKIN